MVSLCKFGQEGFYRKSKIKSKLRKLIEAMSTRNRRQNHFQKFQAQRLHITHTLIFFLIEKQERNFFKIHIENNQFSPSKFGLFVHHQTLLWFHFRPLIHLKLYFNPPK